MAHENVSICAWLKPALRQEGCWQMMRMTLDHMRCLSFTLVAWLAFCIPQAQRPVAAEETTAHLTADDPFTYQDGAVVRGSRSTRQLALVFTGHEFAEGAGAILETLALHGAKASFFLTGDFLRNAEFTPLIRQMLAEGHYVGPHSDKHRLYCAWTPDRRTLLMRSEFEADLNGNLCELERFGVTRIQAWFFLPAYEHHNRDISDWTQMMGLTSFTIILLRSWVQPSFVQTSRTRWARRAAWPS